MSWWLVCVIAIWVCCDAGSEDEEMGGMAWTYVQLGGIGVGAVKDAIVAVFFVGMYPCWWRSWRIGVRALGITYLE